MNFISYAQNSEDVMLWRALKHVKNGFYVDVGANDPVELSVTKAFYDAGWHGVNIDPITNPLLQKERERDINLGIAISTQATEIAFYKVDYSALSTSSPKIAENYRLSGREVEQLVVPAMPLEKVLTQYSEKNIHFMNIDVEGGEKDVLRSFDLSVWRPWIILIESTFPNTQIPTHEDWEPIVLSAGYKFVYFDGLNRFYVAREHEELLDAFQYPPGNFDSYIPVKYYEMQRSKEIALLELEEKKQYIEEQDKIIQLYKNSRAFWLINGPVGLFRKFAPVIDAFSRVKKMLRLRK